MSSKAEKIDIVDIGKQSDLIHIHIHMPGLYSTLPDGNSRPGAYDILNKIIGNKADSIFVGDYKKYIDKGLDLSQFKKSNNDDHTLYRELDNCGSAHVSVYLVFLQIQIFHEAMKYIRPGAHSIYHIVSHSIDPYVYKTELDKEMTFIDKIISLKKGNVVIHLWCIKYGTYKKLKKKYKNVLFIHNLANPAEYASEPIFKGPRVIKDPLHAVKALPIGKKPPIGKNPPIGNSFPPTIDTSVKVQHAVKCVTSTSEASITKEPPVVNYGWDRHIVRDAEQPIKPTAIKPTAIKHVPMSGHTFKSDHDRQLAILQDLRDQRELEKNSEILQDLKNSAPTKSSISKKRRIIPFKIWLNGRGPTTDLLLEWINIPKLVDVFELFDVLDEEELVLEDVYNTENVMEAIELSLDNKEYNHFLKLREFAKLPSNYYSDFNVFVETFGLQQKH